MRNELLPNGQPETDPAAPRSIPKPTEHEKATPAPSQEAAASGPKPTEQEKRSRFTPPVPNYRIPAPEPREPWTLRRFGLLMLEVLVLLTTTIMYLVVVSEGLKSMLPAVFAIKLSNLPIPGFSVFSRFAWSYKLTVGHPFALVLLVFVAIAWVKNMRALLGVRQQKITLWDWFTCYGDDRAARDAWVVRMVGTSLLLADAVVFWNGVAVGAVGTFGGTPVFLSTVLTVLYVSVLVFAAYLHVKLWSRD